MPRKSKQPETSKARVQSLIDRKVRADADIAARVSVLRSEIEERQEELRALLGDSAPVLKTTPVEQSSISHGQPTTRSVNNDLGDIPSFLDQRHKTKVAIP